MTYRVKGPLTIETVTGGGSPMDAVLSPRGDRVAFVLAAGDARQLFHMPVEGGWPFRITPEFRVYGRPTWAPDGRRPASVSENALYTFNADGSDHRQLHEHPLGLSEPAWSPDGAMIAFRSRARGYWPRHRGRPANRSTGAGYAAATSTTCVPVPISRCRPSVE